MSIGGAHIAMELWGGIVCLIASFCLHLERSIRQDREDLLLTILLGTAMLLFADSCAWTFRGDPSPTAWWMVRISNFLVFFLYGGIVVTFASYVMHFMDRPTVLQKTLYRIVWVLAGIAAALLVANALTGLFYGFDAINRYFRTSLFLFLQLPCLLATAVLMALIVTTRREISQLDFVSLLSYALLPFAGGVLSVFFYGISFLNIGITIAVLLMFVNHLMDNTRRLISQEKRLGEAKASILVSQIGPHFLYNTLSTISELCLRDPQLASKATDQFARYMRSNLDGVAKTEPVPFDREIDHVTAYLWLEQLRFGGDLRVVYAFDDTDFELPALTVQPLVENAVKHGLMGREGICTIEVSSRKVEGGHQVIILDDGVGFDTSAPLSSERSHVGMDNVRARIESMVGGTMEVDSMVGVGTRVAITIPGKE